VEGVANLEQKMWARTKEERKSGRYEVALKWWIIIVGINMVVE